jgi:phosphoglycolate phosphatase
MIDLLIFDLDGTLIDSKLDIAHSVNAARAHLGLAPLDLELILTYVGRGAPVLIRKALGPEASDAEIAKALDFFLRNYRAHALDSTALYQGVRESLDRLHEAGKCLAVLSNKPEAISREIARGLDLCRLFFRIYGGDSFPTKKPDPAGVLRLLEESGVSADRAIMVGDSSVDIQTARNAGVRVCAVTYGFAPETLDDPAPDLLIDRLSDLADRVLQSTL